jgi:hypothetical protein
MNKCYSFNPVQSSPVNCCWPSPGQLFLVSSPNKTHNLIYVRSKTVYMFGNGVSSQMRGHYGLLSYDPLYFCMWLQSIGGTTSLHRIYPEDGDSKFPKMLVMTQKPHDVITQKITILNFIAVKTSNLTYYTLDQHQ